VEGEYFKFSLKIAALIILRKYCRRETHNENARSRQNQERKSLWNRSEDG